MKLFLCIMAGALYGFSRVLVEDWIDSYFNCVGSCHHQFPYNLYNGVLIGFFLWALVSIFNYDFRK